jgi:beta-galactosidase/beta-glucuronidase
MKNSFFKICRNKIPHLLLFIFASSEAAISAEQSGLTWIRPPQLQSRWAEELLLKTPLPEYPRPSLVREDWLNLNGAWDFLGNGPTPPQIPDSFSEKAMVPSATQANTSCLPRQYERGWYRKTIQIPESWQGKRILLHCEAIGTKSTIFFDGKELGSSVGGFKRITEELPACEPGKDHQLVIYFDDTDERMQRGKLHRMSGLWQTVWIEAVPTDHILSFKQTPDIDASRLVVEVAASTPNLAVKLTARDQGNVVATASGKAGDSIALNIPNQKLWSPEKPFLYDLEIELLKDGKVLDQAQSYFGMRKISRGQLNGAPRIFLNNEVYYQVGVLEHGRWPDSIFTQPSDACLKWEIETAKEMGFNTIRNHLKIESERWYYWCDKLGMLVWQDLPVPQFFVSPGNRPKKDEDKQLLRDGLREMIAQLYNHPSIISWIIFNEGGAQFEPRQMTLIAKQLDTSRLINTTSHIWLTDEAKRAPEEMQQRLITDYFDTHCYERPLRFSDPNTSYTPSVFGEFGGIGYAIEGHNWKTDRKPWGYGAMATSANELLQEYDKLVKQAVAMRDTHDLCAIIYTEFTDHLDEVNGLITFDRKVVKVDPKTIKEINKQFTTPPQIKLEGAKVPDSK